ncbi:MAG: SDR family NAD(P)-dependent oxidoreductase [Dehalococcoidales bacterium]|nr:SDR family NAD(P)-dependent oxidoreductase [Dehalococcoidales bacterium]
MRIPSMSLKGEVAIVTGARRGIGKETALVLAEAGADVAISDLVTETGELAAVAAEIQSLGRRALTGKVNAAKAEEVQAFTQKVVTELGNVSILVNNAGIGSSFGISEPGNRAEQLKKGQEILPLILQNPGIMLWKEADWDKVLSVNLKSIFFSAQAVAPFMVKNKKGVIVNVTSVEAYARGARAADAYPLSKRGIVMATEGLAVDLGRFGIRVNSIAPGAIDTEMMSILTTQPEFLKYMEQRVVIGNKMLPPVSCAHLILFLTSELAHYITGQTVVIDGGFTLSG